MCKYLLILLITIITWFEELYEDWFELYDVAFELNGIFDCVFHE